MYISGTGLLLLYSYTQKEATITSELQPFRKQVLSGLATKLSASVGVPSHKLAACDITFTSPRHLF